MKEGTKVYNYEHKPIYKPVLHFLSVMSVMSV